MDDHMNITHDDELKSHKIGGAPAMRNHPNQMATTLREARKWICEHRQDGTSLEECNEWWIIRQIDSALRTT